MSFIFLISLWIAAITTLPLTQATDCMIPPADSSECATYSANCPRIPYPIVLESFCTSLQSTCPGLYIWVYNPLLQARARSLRQAASIFDEGCNVVTNCDYAYVGMCALARVLGGDCIPNYELRQCYLDTPAPTPPTRSPTVSPTGMPLVEEEVTSSPTTPTTTTTNSPTDSPTQAPTNSPTRGPTVSPTSSPAA
jgi:hypothetical protein